jgi:type I restriction-modification system DNA methylase subunit
MIAPDTIQSLVDRFDTNRDQLVLPSYNEMQIRREFIDPFFNALGWDIDNKQGTAEAYKDVVHEDAIKIGSATKAPDYSFRIGGTRKFLVEAKKPAVNIKDDVAPAFQLRRYAWSAKLPVSILTDFDELAVYDCRIKPSKTDKSSTARIKYLTYKDYISHWEEIHSIFSHDAVWKGSFDKYVVGTKGKKGTDEVDDVFLKEIESWRDVLARNFALRNSTLTVRELNFAVQRTIDRIIFLRICEDRGIETYGALQALINGERIYKRLCELFQRADERYNSGLFHFAEERGRPERPDTFTLDLKIDDKPLKDIIAGLYYPDCPYEFSILPADILGQVYEQFLGKVIRLTAGHQAKVEEKPEVKKAGGVYYTPTYIVDYIVKNTVGKLVEGKTPKEIAALRVLDPACGSGSFLIGAYQYILDWHHEWYTKDSTEKWSTGKNATLYAGSGGAWRLTTAERKRILLNNIYGVDIDSQAVEVTKLSLLLKVLEGENEQTINQQLKMFHERALPDLGSNIKCGNSLIGPDFFEGQLIVDPDERSRINAFDWKMEFKDIMDAGGFDVVIGNPPYVRQETLGQEFKIYAEKSFAVYHGVADLYAYFVERGVSLLRVGGMFGYIVANKWLRANYGEPLRRWLKDKGLVEIIDFGDLPVFSGATTYPCILRVKKGSEESSFNVTQVESLEFQDLQEYSEGKQFSVRIGGLDDSGWSLSNEATTALLNRLRGIGIPLGKYVNGKIFRGVLTGLNEAFVIDEAKRKELIAKDKRSADLIKPFLAGRDIKRYAPQIVNKYVIFARRGVDIRQYPAIEQHLRQFKTQLDPKPPNWKGGEWEGRKPGSYKWYEIQDTVDYYAEFEKPKLLLPDISTRGNVVFDERGEYYSVNTTYIIANAEMLLLGLLNSALITFFYRQQSSTIRGGYLRFIFQYLEQIPIRCLDLQCPADKSFHDRMVRMVESMLHLHEDLPKAKTDHERTALQRQIDETDKQIDALVYELYGLTEEEIMIVEGTADKKGNKE